MNVKTKNTLFSFFGHIFEHFESSIFAFSGVFIATYFFPSTDDTWLGRYGIYVAISSGFIMAPLGALVFSWIGDKYGRRPALIAAYVSGVVPTLIIPFIPSYALIGFTSSAILIACRFLQGIGSGGAFTGRIVFLSELHGAARNINLGILMSLGFVGALLGTSLSSLFMDITFIDWGWKIPYIIASLMGITILIVRRCLVETTPWLEEKKSTSRVPFFRCLTEYPREITVVLLFGMATLMPFYLGVSWIGGYLKTHFNLTSSAILETTSYLMIVAGLSVFIFFWLATYIKPYILLLFGVLMTFILGGMIYVSLHTDSLYLLTCTQFMIAVQTGLLTSPVMLLSQGFFPTKFRFSGMSIPFSTGQALMTGTTPLFAEIIVQISGYNEAVCLIIFLSGIFLGASAYLIYRLDHTPQL